MLLPFHLSCDDDDDENVSCVYVCVSYVCENVFCDVSCVYEYVSYVSYAFYVIFYDDVLHVSYVCA